jgi:DNA-binding response OmpR family regulator
MNELVAILEDEPDIRALIAAALKIERFRVREYCDGRGFLSSLATEKPALAS